MSNTDKPIAPTFRANLREAHHIICYRVAAPTREQVRNRHTRIYQTDSLQDLAKYVKHYVQSGHRVALAVPEDGSGDEAATVVDDEYEAHVIGERTLINTSKRIGYNLLHNIKNYSHLPFITDLDRPLKGVPAFIVYSGYSLDRNIHLLSECQKHGVVITSATPIKALLKFGIQPDILVCIESREQGAVMQGAKPQVYVCDMTAAKQNWEVDTKHTLRMYQPDLSYLQYCLKDGTMPIGNGGFIGSLAVNLAYMWGANPIVLIGFDLALTDDHSCTQHIGSDTVVRYEDVFAIFQGSHACAGRSFWTEVPAWGLSRASYGLDALTYAEILEISRIGKWPLVRTTYERVGYRKWLENFADLAKDIDLINATGGGSYIVGWEEMTLTETLQTATWHAKVHDHRNRLGEQLKALDEQNRRALGEKHLAGIRHACERIIELGQVNTVESEMEIRQLSRNEPILYALLTPKFVMLKYSRPTEIQRLKAIRKITVDCAAKMLEMLDEL